LRLQGALGELTFESEAAERLKVEIRAERAATRELKDRLAQAQVRKLKHYLHRYLTSSLSLTWLKACTVKYPIRDRGPSPKKNFHLAGSFAY
jgi:hypothetical protein